MEEVKDMTTEERTRSLTWGDLVSAQRRQLRALRPVMLLIYTPLAIAFGIVIAVRIRTGIAIAEFTRDPLGFTDIPVYTGVLSNLGAVIWSGAAAVCFFSYGISQTRAGGGASPHFLLAGGLITLLLLLDDFFMLHEVVFPEHVGIPEDVVYTTYAVLLLGFLVWFRATILQTDYLLLALGLAGLGFSIGVDLIASMVSLPGLYVFEDGAKLFGIVSWAAYFVLVSARRIVAGEYGDRLETEDAALHARDTGEAR